MAKILIVEDEPEIRDLLRRILTKMGHAVCEAEDGLLAQQVLAQEPIDLVLTDVLMPRCSGIEFLKSIRLAGFDVPAIAVSGGGGTGGPALMLEQAIAAGATTGVAKPFMPNDIVQAVESLLPSPAPE